MDQTSAVNPLLSSLGATADVASGVPSFLGAQSPANLRLGGLTSPGLTGATPGGMSLSPEMQEEMQLEQEIQMLQLEIMKLEQQLQQQQAQGDQQGAQATQGQLSQATQQLNALEGGSGAGGASGASSGGGGGGGGVSGAGSGGGGGVSGASSGGGSGGGGGTGAGVGGPIDTTGTGGQAVSIAASQLGKQAQNVNLANYSAAGGQTNDCADFVSACVADAGLFHKSAADAGVVNFRNDLVNQGWQAVSQKDAKPGDVAIILGGGVQHTELVANNGATTCIGANGTSQESISKDNPSGWATGVTYYAPPSKH